MDQQPPIKEKRDAFMDLLFRIGCEYIFNPKPDENKTTNGDAGVDAAGPQSDKTLKS